MKKRALMIADADGVWTKRYIENLLLPAGYEVVLFPIWGNEGKYAAFYAENSVTVYQDTHTLPIIRHIPRLRMWERMRLNARDLRALGPFDVIHNHYLSQRDLALGDKLHKAFPTARWVCSFWGSDLLRSSLKEHARMRPYLCHADAITIHAAPQRDLIAEIYGKNVADKTALVYFGQTVYDDIDCIRVETEKTACKAHFGIPAEHKVVCVGYNASPAQYQPQVLRALVDVPAEMMENMTVVLQLTYGRSDEKYLAEVQAAADALPCQTLILTEFMDGAESAKLRLCADVFILAIQTDSFSASLQEYLYASTKVLVADWLHYPQLEELGIETTLFHDYAELPALLAEALQSDMSDDQQLKCGKLKQHYSWPAVREGWLRLYR